MKQCPACKTTYTDATLRFCLSDGTPLTDLDNEQPTVQRPAGKMAAEETLVLPREAEQMRVDIRHPQANDRTVTERVSPPPAVASSGRFFKILSIVVGLGIFAILAVAAGVFIYMNMSGQQSPANTDIKTIKSPVPPTPSPTVDDKDLRDQIANLQKQLDDQKGKKEPANIPVEPLNPATMTKTARVNSPSDGFLALRTLPDSELGERVMKIPHGATVAVGACGPVVQPVKRRGRWCQASFNGKSGWVFDAYLSF